ncbi:MAG: IS3 family transposase [Nitrospirota bacterium]|nr:IS3 family transposase [Nitrospirota bacterium]MDH5775493.1 IS3 family transposase [Nitrospirota bacterium]
MKYAFIQQHRQEFRITRLCATLQVSRSGFYAWHERPESPRAQQNRHLLTQMQVLHQQTREAYGARKMWQLLKQQGHDCGRHRVARLRGLAGIVARRRRRFVRTIHARPEKVSLPNQLNREFTVAEKNRVWAADLTYIPTRAGWLYLAVLVDLYSRRVVGWAMSERQTTTLVVEAWRMAWAQRRPAVGLLHHSDQGNQYTASLYRTMLTRRGVVLSLSRKGNCYDNAVVESFFSTLKNELTHERSFQDRTEARQAIFEYIEGFYNRQRLHQTLSYRSPVEFERETGDS